MKVLAPAKINVCLFLGPTRPDGRHELVTVFDNVSLCDELTIEPAAADEVLCPAVPGPNLVGDALAALRVAGWDAPPVRVTIDKRIPVAAGLGGGSADAAALLRTTALAPDILDRVAASLGADVPSQLRPGLSVGTGTGADVGQLPALGPYGVLVVPAPFGLATADVYREADQLGLPRSADDLHGLAHRLLEPGHIPELALNDLEPAALSLAPSLADTLAQVRTAGADQALVCGSGPTIIGLFWGPEGEDRARRAAPAVPGSLPVAPIDVSDPAVAGG